MRKSILSIALCLVLLLSMSTTAFAAESGDIKVTYSHPDAEKVTIVDIAWGSMEFNYDSGDTKVWNPETLQYEINHGEDGGTWTPKNENGDTVTVTNHSNTGLLVTVTYTPDADNGVTGSVENNSFLLATAEGTAVGEAPKGNATLELDNASVPAQWSTEGATTIGNITVKLEHCDVQVSTAEEFEAALENGGTIMLTGDITMSDEYLDGYEITKNTTIDLNGHTITGECVFNSKKNIVLTISGNGTIIGTNPNVCFVIDGRLTLNILGGTIEGGTNIFGTTVMSGGRVNEMNTDKNDSDDDTSYITGGYVGKLSCWGGILKISGGHVEALIQNFGTIIISGGTFGFDPTEYLAEGYIATEADGVWTVTAN